MIRQCFLCNESLEQVFSTDWPLPGLETSEIGFSVCPNCGSVSQSPTVEFEQMMQFYQSLAVYTNPGRDEKPSTAKIRDVDEQLQFITRGIGELPESVLQIGSSDGYTLSRFKAAGIKKVLGIEPGTASVEIAKRVYDVDCINSSAETFATEDSYELILLTHILEHLYQPQTILKKCRSIQCSDKENSDKESFIYVEVPLIAPLDSLCPGFFSFEHINYYSRGNLTRSLIEAGYSPVSLVEHYNSNLSPIIGILASTREQQHLSKPINEYQQNRSIVSGYRQKEVNYWQSCLDSIQHQLLNNGKIYLWGAGIHTSQLVANTNLLQQFEIAGLVDTSPLKWQVRQGDWVCQNPADIDWHENDMVIISSYASEDEIYKALDWLREKGVTTLRLHNVGDVKAH